MIPLNNPQRESFLILLMYYMRIPYLWGGKDKAIGLDCSGLVNCVMKEIDMAPPSVLSAQGMFDFYSQKGMRVLSRSADVGDLVFFGDKIHIHHVGIALNSFLMLEAAHGDETVTSVEIAKQRGAYVTANPISRFKDLYAVVRPADRPW